MLHVEDLLIVLIVTGWFVLLWLGMVTWKVWGYRAAILKLQREMTEVIDELTAPKVLSLRQPRKVQ